MKKCLAFIVGISIFGLVACDWLFYPLVEEQNTTPIVGFGATNTRSVFVSETGDVESIESISLTGLERDHAEDLTIKLQAPSFETITLVSGEGGNADYNGNYKFVDDNDSAGLPRIVVYNDGGATNVVVPETYQSEGDLDDFEGTGINGTWTLIINDAQSTGNSGIAQLTSWTLRLRYSGY
jgi:subtilisin-like proprotein convertase family protein